MLRQLNERAKKTSSRLRDVALSRASADQIADCIKVFHNGYVCMKFQLDEMLSARESLVCISQGEPDDAKSSSNWIPSVGAN